MRRASIAISLGMAFAFLLAILVGMGWFGVARIGRLNTKLNDTVARQWTKFQLARDLELYTRQNNQISQDIILAQSDRSSATPASKALMAHRSENRLVIDDLSARLQPLLDNPREKQLFSDLQQTRSAYAQQASRALDMSLQGSPEEARDLMLKQIIPLRDKYYTAREAFVQFEEHQVNEAKFERDSRYAAAHRLAMWMVALALLTATLIAVFVTIRLTREVSRREQVEDDILALNGNLEFKVRERTRELASAMDQLEGQIAEREETAAALRRSEESFRSLVENSPYGILRVTSDGIIQQANKALLDMLGYRSEQEILGLSTGADLFLSAAEHRKIVNQFGNLSAVRGIEVQWKRKDGKPINVRYARHTVRDANGLIRHKEIIVEDISEKRVLEQQLRQAQKMEAIGRLAGGVAHDFNNMLGVIIGYSDLILDQDSFGDSARGQIEQIKKAGERARALTRQLLAFSRKQVLETRVLNLNDVVADMQKMLHTLLGEDIEIRAALDPTLDSVRGDQSQLEQVIVNLAANARDAMPDGGSLVLETANVELDELAAASRPGTVAGHYVMLSVTDSGTGMDVETLSHIYEPFFTTKGPGRGTGLGLATVYGIVKQSGGYILAESEIARGSCFRIYFPRTEQAAQPKRLVESGSLVPKRSEVVLLAEDEESLRQLTRTQLIGAGYTVLEAANGREALEVAARHKGAIDLLLTDVIMPGMNGRALADQLTARRPEMRVVYMSGHTDILSSEFGNPDLKLLQKPFTRAALLGVLAQVLDEHHRQPAQAVA